jgi:hypothetical protein
MDVEIILDQNDGPGVGEVDIGQTFQDRERSPPRCGIGDFDTTPAFERCKS